MEAAVIVAVISGVVGLISAVYSARSASRTSAKKTEADERLALRQLEAGAFERAKAFYETTLTGMQAEIARQAEQMQRDRDQQARQIGSLQRQVSRLTRQVREAGLVPVTSSEDDM